jgi:hypothetical protein
MASAVPAGEVMARDDVLGITTPQAATMGTTISVVRLPGRPPTQCFHHRRKRPADALAHIDHGARERHDFRLRQASAGASRDERREVQVRYAAPAHVVDERAH